MSFSFNQRYFTLALPLLIVVTLAVLAGCGSTSTAKWRYRSADCHLGVRWRDCYRCPDQHDRYWVVGQCGQRLEFLVFTVHADRKGWNYGHLQRCDRRTHRDQ